jgi:hypothetical protein
MEALLHVIYCNRDAISKDIVVAITAMIGRNCEHAVLVDAAHVGDLSHPIFFTVLNDAKRIYPEISIPKPSRDQDRIVKKLRELIHWQCLLVGRK